MNELDADIEATRETLWQMVWRTLADHQWGNWECSCGGGRKGSGEYEDNHLADVLSVKIAGLLAQAWDEGKHSEHAAVCRLGDIPDECTCPNPYAPERSSR